MVKFKIIGRDNFIFINPNFIILISDVYARHAEAYNLDSEVYYHFDVKVSTIDDFYMSESFDTKEEALAYRDEFVKLIEESK